MAGGGDCLAQPQDGAIVPVALDAGMLATLDAYCRRFGLDDRCEAINELLMVGLSWSMRDPDPTGG